MLPYLSRASEPDEYDRHRDDDHVRKLVADRCKSIFQLSIDIRLPYSFSYRSMILEYRTPSDIDRLRSPACSADTVVALLIGGALLVAVVVAATVVLLRGGAGSSHWFRSLQYSIDSVSYRIPLTSPTRVRCTCRWRTRRTVCRGARAVGCAGRRAVSGATFTTAPPHHTLTMCSAALGRGTVAAKAVAGNEASEK